MGLKLTIDKDRNSMGFTFEDAYWVIENLKYEMGSDELFVSFNLNCYPSRESSKLTGQNVAPMEYMEPTSARINGKLCGMHHLNFVKTIFPEGIPMERDAQLKVIYSFIKEYTGLPFEDVFEDDQKEGEPIVEPSEPTEPTEPIEEPTEEPIEEPAAEEPAPEPESDPEPETYHNPLSL